MSSKIDWSKASDDQLAEARAEQKRREPLHDFDDLQWGTMGQSEFEQKGSAVFRAVRRHSAEQRIEREHVEAEAERAARRGAQQ